LTVGQAGIDLFPQQNCHQKSTFLFQRHFKFYWHITAKDPNMINASLIDLICHRFFFPKKKERKEKKAKQFFSCTNLNLH